MSDQPLFLMALNAIQKDDAASLQAMVEQGLNVNEGDALNGWTLLMHASNPGNIDQPRDVAVVNVLLQAGADPLLSSKDGAFDPLLLAITRNQRHLLPLLVRPTTDLSPYLPGGSDAHTARWPAMREALLVLKQDQECALLHDAVNETPIEVFGRVRPRL